MRKRAVQMILSLLVTVDLAALFVALAAFWAASRLT